MSRSYKKSPYCTDNGNSKKSKKIANRITRKRLKNDILPKGKKYKHMYCSYNICDYKFRSTKEETIKNFSENEEKNSSLDEHLNSWAKYYYRK